MKVQHFTVCVKRINNFLKIPDEINNVKRCIFLFSVVLKDQTQEKTEPLPTNACYLKCHLKPAFGEIQKLSIFQISFTLPHGCFQTAKIFQIFILNSEMCSFDSELKGYEVKN